MHPGGGIVNEHALIKAFSTMHYCTDVYSNEPAIQKDIVDNCLLATPHIAGHSIEAKYRAVELISKKIHQRLELPFPNYLSPDKPIALDYNNNSWQQWALTVYNPANETRLLKQATALEQAFNTLRKNHQFRHDFTTYFNKLIPDNPLQLV